MVFGALIDVPLLVVTFILMLIFGKRIAHALGRVDVPLFLLFLFLSTPLIVFEEDIDCMPAWCGKVVIPPTLPFLLFEVLILGLIATRFRPKSAFRLVLAYCVFGVGWELTVGGLRGAPALVDLILVPYVALGYAFVSMLPLQVLLEPRQSPAQKAPKSHIKDGQRFDSRSHAPVEQLLLVRTRSVYGRIGRSRASRVLG